MSDSHGIKVGPLAEASGLTIRTLHHWDSIGLLTASRRDGSGHREYTDEDLGRLYQIVALRQLGLDLAAIGTCLDAGVDPQRILSDHRAMVDEAATVMTALRDRLHAIEREVSAAGHPSTIAIIDAIHCTQVGAETRQRLLDRHLDEDQQASLRSNAAAVGPAARYHLEIEWPALYRQVEQLRRSGAEPASPPVQRAVSRMDELSTMFGGSSSSSGVRSAWHEDPAAMSGEPTAPAEEWRALADFVAQARAAR